MVDSESGFRRKIRSSEEDKEVCKVVGGQQLVSYWIIVLIFLNKEKVYSLYI